AGRLHVVAELEPDRGALGEWTVVDLERRFRLRQSLQRDVAVAGDGVMKHRVAMAESPALDVLTREPDGGAVFEDRGERQIFSGGPVDRPSRRIVQHRPALLAGTLQLL